MMICTKIRKEKGPSFMTAPLMCVFESFGLSLLFCFAGQTFCLRQYVPVEALTGHARAIFPTVMIFSHKWYAVLQ